MRKQILSPAKINLGLSITGRRDDGFHCLESLFWPLNFGDKIDLIEGTGRVSLTWGSDAPYTSTQLPSEKENIVTKVLKALSPQTIPFDINIEKRIPMGGGMGGGSSNIGTLLRFLQGQQLINNLDLLQWSSRFGADIPFFLCSQPAWVTGIGENVQPLMCDPELFKNLYFLLVLFPVGCETKLIFEKFKSSKTPFSTSQNPFPAGQISMISLKQYLSKAKNDLEPSVSGLYPNIKRVLEKLRSQNCLYAGLSGSGATCFAVFESSEERQKTAKDLSGFFRDNNCKGVSAETFASS
jgi:4-diphosphocytidyl-2-C-methyl-D-erythritol kinase